MTETGFIESIDNLVREWATKPGDVPREQLKEIYNTVREEAVHGIALLQQRRDKALVMLHKRNMKGENER